MNFLRRAKPSSLRSLLNGGLGSKFSSIRPPPSPQGCQETGSPGLRSIFTGRAGYYRLEPSPSAAAQWRRSYYVYPREVQHFRRRRARWHHDPRAVVAVVIIGGGAAVTLYYGNRETVPYTKRKHFVLLSPAVERQLGEAQFQQLKAALQDKILPAIHPDSVRVRLIAKELIDAVQRGLRHSDAHWSDMRYSQDVPAGLDFPDERTRGALIVMGEEGRPSGDVWWTREDELLDDEWIDRSRKEGTKHGSQPVTKHLVGLNWEVIVVRDKMVNAMCLPGGKIVVFTGLLDHFRTDAEIATVLGHEIGHAIARHAAEAITKNLWFALLQIILLQFFYMPDVINAMSNLLLRLPFSRRMEIEADYVGLLLLASAGYDPQVAPRVYEKLGQITKDSALNDYLSTHPSSKRRAQLLSQAKVMEEALVIYSEAIAGRGVEGFL